MVDYQTLLTSNIKKLRKTSGLTQEKFAELVDISVDGIRNLEHNKYAPTAKTIDNICSAFNITPFELLLPDIQQDDKIVEQIHNKLKLCDNDKLKRISKIIDLVK